MLVNIQEVIPILASVIYSPLFFYQSRNKILQILLKFVLYPTYDAVANH